ncbi:MAG: hypothetical protein AVDCRST_MAG59-2687, partial [uncultured Thermomicrobiales bacterium]
CRGSPRSTAGSDCCHASCGWSTVPPTSSCRRA